MGDGDCRALPAPERSIRRSSTSARLASSSPQRTRGGPALSESGLSSERSTLETGHQLEPSSSHRRSPLDQIEGAVERWCQGKSTPSFSNLYSLWRT